ncbi:MAG: 2-oxo acid dehydrogenase subunit E2 [Deltaproteobacteria bacterium]|nr:2-oxo acid dehydrogenase subunit E2 [Deltaproteobacteria bacterium]
MTTQFSAVDNASSFRRMAASMWTNPTDPSIYGSMDVDVTSTLVFIEKFRKETGLQLTMTHVVARATAQAFAHHRELNAKVRFWGKLEQRQTVDLFVSVSTDGGKDLSGVRMDATEDLSLTDMVHAIKGRARAIRDGDDATYQRSRNLFKTMPWFMARPALWLTDLLTNELHLDLPSQGMPRDPFGTCVITNVGSFGIDTAFAPFLPLARCPMLLLMTEVKDRAVVVDGELAVRPILRLCGTFDHRIIDGFHAGLLAKDIRTLVENPEATLGAAVSPLPAPQPVAAPAPAIRMAS